MFLNIARKTYVILITFYCKRINLAREKNIRINETE